MLNVVRIIEQDVVLLYAVIIMSVLQTFSSYIALLALSVSVTDVYQ